MRVEVRDIGTGVLVGSAALLVEAVVCRAVQGRFFVYPWLQSGLAVGVGGLAIRRLVARGGGRRAVAQDFGR